MTAPGTGEPRRLKALDATMTYRAAGAAEAPVVLFLHGNPTSSYIWRNVIAHVAPVARCVAPDLVGFGNSDRPEIEYRFTDHVRYLDAFLDAAGIDAAYIVAQDWGTALAFNLAARRPEAIRGLAFMEFIRPLDSWDDFHQTPEAREAFKAFRTPGVGERLILEQNVFLERILPGSVVRTLSDEELDAYRAPFPTPESRRPIWRLVNELPIEGDPADVDLVLGRAHEALRTSTYSKLLFVGDPGALVSPSFADAFAAQLVDCTVVRLGSGRHYLQEDHADAIGLAIAEWIAGLETHGAEPLIATAG
jgi:haloalkane dehalogenase